MTATWLWLWSNIDQTERSDGEGWSFQGTAQITPGHSLQRAIFRVGIAGSQGVNSVSLPGRAPAWLGTANLDLFSLDPGYTRPLWSQYWGMSTTGVGFSGPEAVPGGYSGAYTWGSPPLEFDANVRKKIAPEDAVFLAWQIGIQPVPEQDPDNWSYGADWRCRGQLLWLESY